MLDLVQVLSYCDDLAPVINLVKAVLGLIQFGIPILLILMGTIDLGKAVISSDEKEVKKAQSTLIKRCIYAVAVFFVVFLVTLLMNLVAENGGVEGANSWKSCWNSSSSSNKNEES